MGDCTHNCSTCSADCASREKQDLHEAPNPLSKIGKVIGVVSGKGGVGKSLVTALTAVSVHRTGATVGILDADITGPSVPKMFGANDKRAEADENGIYPVKSPLGIDLMSVNLLLENPSDPVIWRGPVIAGAVKQFWTDVVWGDDDFLFVDMPPGTGDVPLTVFQSLPVTGAVVVSSPQDLVRLIVEKAVRMAGMMKIPVLGLVENMSSFKCPSCSDVHRIFGDSKAAEIGREYGIGTVVEIPIDMEIARAVDSGTIEDVDVSAVDPLLSAIV